jgi:hypothetical protein
MRLIYKMSPRCNNGRFATPKHERRGVCQIAPEQPLVGVDHGNPEVIAGSVPRTGLEEISGDFLQADFWTEQCPVCSASISQ